MSNGEMIHELQNMGDNDAIQTQTYRRMMVAAQIQLLKDVNKNCERIDKLEKSDTKMKAVSGLISAGVAGILILIKSVFE